MSARLALALGAWALLPPARVAAAAARGQYVDPDTPSSEMYRVDKFGRKLELVMSDEFTVDGRAFGEGDDAMWTANHNRDTTNRAGPPRACRACYRAASSRLVAELARRVARARARHDRRARARAIRAPRRRGPRVHAA